VSLQLARGAYLTRAELAEHLGVSEKTIARWQTEGPKASRLPTEMWGSRLYRYKLDRVEAWLARRTKASAA
jgi:excisionase family DNA binding protein